MNVTIIQNLQVKRLIIRGTVANVSFRLQIYTIYSNTKRLFLAGAFNDRGRVFSPIFQLSKIYQYFYCSLHLHVYVKLPALL